MLYEPVRQALPSLHAFVTAFRYATRTAVSFAGAAVAQGSGVAGSVPPSSPGARAAAYSSNEPSRLPAIVTYGGTENVRRTTSPARAAKIVPSRALTVTVMRALRRRSPTYAFASSFDAQLLDDGSHAGANVSGAACVRAIVADVV